MSMCQNMVPLKKRHLILLVSYKVRIKGKN